MPTGESLSTTSDGSAVILDPPPPAAADCLKPGPVRWRDNVIIDPANPTPKLLPAFVRASSRASVLPIAVEAAAFRARLAHRSICWQQVIVRCSQTVHKLVGWAHRQLCVHR